MPITGAAHREENCVMAPSCDMVGFRQGVHHGYSERCTWIVKLDDDSHPTGETLVRYSSILRYGWFPPWNTEALVLRIHEIARRSGGVFRGLTQPGPGTPDRGTVMR